MSSSTFNYPPLPLVNITPSQTIYSTGIGGNFSLTRSDTTRRKVPVPLDETSVSTQVADTKHFVCSYTPNASYHYETSSTVLGIFNRPVTGDLYARTINIAENRLRSQARNAGVNLAQMMAEYRQTAELFGDLSRQAYNLYRNVRRGNWRRAYNTYNRSKDWLQWQYGIRPLMSDIYDSYQDIRHAAQPSPVVRSSAQALDVRQDKAYYLSMPYTYTTVIKCKVTCKARVNFDYSFLSNTLTRHGLTNPLALAWELVPFSFVVDWWTNIGEVLESLDNCLVFSSLSGSTSIVQTEEVKCESGYFHYTYKVRNAKTFSNVSSFVYKPSTSLTHIANGLALWRSLR